MTSRPYQICSRCVMDTSDPAINFDGAGVCNHCRTWQARARLLLWKGDEAAGRLGRFVERMRKDGKGKDYDCVIGVSGGVDSTYVAYVVKHDLGLRPLAVHMDNGWNSTMAVTNIERTLDRLGVDLETEVLEWDEFRDLQLSFLRASTPDSEVPTDHAIQAVLMRTARKHGLRYVVGGSNLASEGILPTEWGHGILDWKYIRGLHRRFGSVPLRTFPHFSMASFVSFWTLERRQRFDVLNYVPYERADAMTLIQRELGWQDYGGKHHESVYTRFFQAYILPRKFGFDKRRAHLAALINSGQLRRDEALAKLEEPICPPDLLRQDLEFVVKKLGITEAEFERIMTAPPRTFFDYPSYERSWWYSILRGAYRLPRRFRAAARGE